MKTNKIILSAIIILSICLCSNIKIFANNDYKINLEGKSKNEKYYWINGDIDENYNLEEKFSASTSSLEDTIFYVGGTDGTRRLTKLESYNVTTGKWIHLSDMSIPREDLSTCIYDGKLYCIGGENSTTGSLKDIEIYNINNNSWDTPITMPTGRRGLISEVVDGKIYCIGGDTGITSDKVEIYDIKSNSWSTGENMPTPRRHFSSVVIGKKIYCISGLGTTNNTMDIYDTETNTWETKKGLTTDRGGFVSVSWGNKIYCIGGHNNSSYLNTTEIYDIESDTWQSGLNMPTARGYLSGEIINGKIYCIGGLNGSNLNIIEILCIDELKNQSNSFDLYINPQNVLSLSVDTNSIVFDEFSNTSDMEILNAINLSVESTLPYEVNSYLMKEIQGIETSNIIDKSILNIKSSSNSNYNIFLDIGITPVKILDNQSPGKLNVHGVDLKLSAGIDYEVDIYKTALKFEVCQK